MSNIIANPPKWNAKVESATLGNGVSLLSDDVETLNTKIQAFVQTSFFQTKLAELGNDAKKAFTIQLIFEDGAIKLKKEGSKDETLTLPASTNSTTSTPEITAMEETTTLVKEMAAYYLNSTTQKKSLTSTGNNKSNQSSLGCASSFTPKAPANTLTEYGIHGIKNPKSRFCYANSAYQILANVPSLKTSVIDRNDNLDYKNIKDGEKLFEAVNTFKTTDPFKLDKVYDASEVFEALINSTNSTFPQFTLETTEEFLDIKPTDQNTTTENLPSNTSNDQERIFACGLPLNGDINFKNIITSKLVQTSEITENSNEAGTYTKKITKKFTSQPKQLLIQLERKTVTTGTTDATITFNDQFIEGIPMTLNLQEYDAIKEPLETSAPLELKGFTVHKGPDGSSGHYIAYFKKENPQKKNEYQWFCANDSEILIVPETEVIKALGHAHNLYYDDTETPSTSLSRATPLISYTQSLARNSITPLTTNQVNNADVPLQAITENISSESNTSSITQPATKSTSTLERLARTLSLKTIRDSFF